MGFFTDLIVGSIVGGALGSSKGGIVGALLQKDGSFSGAVAGGLIGSLFEDDRKTEEAPTRYCDESPHFDDEL
jgi:outer membrane lipoprotein SlyB